jgi:ATPase subunit of ABC transporter with duplicated ATPase domains
MRAALARVLLQKPDLLLLDEPTNHLDIEAVQWLEEYLRSYRGAVLLVSHDRYFLDRVVTRIFEIEHQTLQTFRGNYSAYVLQKRRICGGKPIFSTKRKKSEKSYADLLISFRQEQKQLWLKVKPKC